jgi:hypothetical protein
MTAASEPP